MKKKHATIVMLVILIGAVFLSQLLLAPNSIPIDDEEILRLIRRKENISDNSSLTIIGNYYDENEHRLLCVVETGELFSAYYAFEFGAHKYTSYNKRLLTPRGDNMYTLEWDHGYVFISDNPNNKSIEIHFLNTDSDEIRIDVLNHPFCYYLDLSQNSECAFEYFFLDDDGCPMHY